VFFLPWSLRFPGLHVRFYEFPIDYFSFLGSYPLDTPLFFGPFEKSISLVDFFGVGVRGSYLSGYLRFECLRLSCLECDTHFDL
jgi:uncharacterized RDD family membrane protein YckC